MGRLRGCVWLTAGLVVALLAGFVGFMALSRPRAAGPAAQTDTAPQVQVVVAAHAVPVRSALKAEDLEVRSMPVDAAPEGSLRQVSDAAGRVTLAEIYAGETVLAQRLIDPNAITNNGRYAVVLAEDEVLMAFPAEDLLSRSGVLKPGDHVDLLFSLDVTTEPGAQGAGDEKAQQTFNVLPNVTVAAVVGGAAPQDAAAGIVPGEAAAPAPAEPTALLLTITPQDALVLKYVRDAGGTVDMILRAPGADQPFETEPVDTDYLINRYRLPIEPGR